jgi:SAM-dependent methyltransferase
MLMICKICNSEIDAAPFEVKEMMFGFKTVHRYYECGTCEALQIETVPADLGKYYPENYYSFKQYPDASIDTTWLRKVKSGHLLYGKNKIAGSLLSIGYKIPEHIPWLKIAGVGYDDAILDVGSGNGDILVKYCKAGFTNLQGIDPFLKQEFVAANGKLKLLRKSIFDKQELDAYDLVMLNHSFEHMDAPQAIFQRLSELVKPGKILLIRTPVNKSFASEKYKEDWVDMDPPRHLVVHSHKSIQLLAEKNGFSLEQVVYDSTAFQFWGSEQYLKGVSLHDAQSYAVNKKTTLFTESQIEEWKRQAKELNKSGKGDQACFYLRRK